MSFALFNAIPSDPVIDQLFEILDKASSNILSKSSNFELFKFSDSLNSLTIQTQHHKTALSAEA